MNPTKPPTKIIPRRYVHSTIDQGCNLNSSCLNCPFNRCKYDEPSRNNRTTDTRSVLKEGVKLLK